jgi:hypothetical protein
MDSKKSVKRAIAARRPPLDAKSGVDSKPGLSPIFIRGIMLPFVQSLAFPGGPYTLIDSIIGQYTVVVRGLTTATSAVFQIGLGSVTQVSSTGPGTIIVTWTQGSAPTITASDDTPADTFHTMVVAGF